MKNQLYINLSEIKIGSPEFYQLGEFIQLDLVKDSDNEELLYEVVWANSKYTALCYAAIQNIADEEKLFDIVNKHSNHLVRRAAVEKITNNQKLASIYNNESDWTIRYLAIKNTTNVALAKKATNDDSGYVRSVARTRLAEIS